LEHNTELGFLQGGRRLASIDYTSRKQDEQNQIKAIL
jgi:hypothetical protein